MPGKARLLTGTAIRVIKQVIKVVDQVLAVGLTDITFAGVAWDT